MANLRKPVQQFSITNVLLNTYPSIAEAANSLGLDESTIRRALDVFHKTAGGYKWTSLLEEEIITNENDSKISEFDAHLEKLGLSQEDVKSVKFWQTASGDFRYSIVKNFEEEQETVEDFLDKLKEKLSILEPVRIPQKPSEPTPKALIIHTADKHVGALTKADSLYNNDYDASIFKTRLYSILDLIYEEYELHGRFDTLIFNDIGDPLDGYNGYTTRGGHKLPQNMTDREAFDLYVEAHAKFFDQLVAMDVANNIRFYSVTEDNHSGAFGYSANRALEIYLNAKYPDISTTIMKKFIEHFQYGNHTYMLCHGKDTEDLKGPMPLRIDAKAENYIKDYIDNYNLTGTLHFVKGDLHQNAVQYLKKFRYKNVLSLYGASKWIQSNFGNTRGGVCYDVVEKFSPKIYEGFITF